MVPKLEVTPLGRPEALSVTLPLKPFEPATLICAGQEPPGCTASEDGEALREKLPVEVTASEKVVLEVNTPVLVAADVPVIVTG